MSPERQDRMLAAILVADMAGYSRLIEADEAGTVAPQKSCRGELIDPTVSQYSGRIVKTMGDGLLVEFNSVVDAVECAIAIQRAMSDRDSGVPEERLIQYRVGINTGDVIIDGDDILGDTVNVAARLEALAEPKIAHRQCLSRYPRASILSQSIIICDRPNACRAACSFAAGCDTGDSPGGFFSRPRTRRQ